MDAIDDKKPQWTICLMCEGQGKIMGARSRKKRRLFRIAAKEAEATIGNSSALKSLSGNVHTCPSCKGSGLITCENVVHADFKKYPNIAIIGCGIGGAALAVACLHRGIPFTLYERDTSFNSRSQGYGLTLQQASKAIQGLGIFSLDRGLTSTKHVVFNQEGKIIDEWGLRKWNVPFEEKPSKRRNIHIARETLRSMLLQNLVTSKALKWNHTLANLSNNNDGTVDLTFQVGGNQEIVRADLVVGADGIRSQVRELTIGEHETPLVYLGCIVLLGICPLKLLDDRTSPLLDSATVFQTLNGHERIYMMPYDADTIMWQLSFPLSETEAKELSSRGAKAMKDEAFKRLSTWHDPIPAILMQTLESDITGYPVYDRKLFDPSTLHKKGNVTLLGDAAHPMSPFKGQGANQAILDALTLARKIFEVCNKNPRWREIGIRKSVLNMFEEEMALRSASKVEGSAKAVHLLHSDATLTENSKKRGHRSGFYL